MKQNNLSQYFLQVVKAGEYPKWPVEENELIIGHRPLGSGFVQCWAYPKESGVSPDQPPFAETLASRHPTEGPAILIDQQPDLIDDGGKQLLDIVLVKSGHAWMHTYSSLDNLEDNLGSLADFADSKFALKLEKFLTTDRVGKEVEDKLEEMEKQEKENGEEEAEIGSEKLENISPQDSSGSDSPDSWQIRKISPSHPAPFPTTFPRKTAVGDMAKSNNFPSPVLIATIILVMIIGGAAGFRNEILSKWQFNSSLENKEAAVTPTPPPAGGPTSTPIPTPAVERKDFKIRVLNSTTETGAAGNLGAALKKLGWQIIETGNARTKNLALTQVRMKEKTASLSATLIQDLGSDFETTASADLKASDKADLEVIIGKK